MVVLLIDCLYGKIPLVGVPELSDFMLFEAELAILLATTRRGQHNKIISLVDVRSKIIAFRSRRSFSFTT
jgi:hypothetical protein